MDYLSAEGFPWLDDARRRLLESRQLGRLPHSLLLLSVPGLGAENLAAWAAALALCESGGKRPCGACASCQLLSADTHPDAHIVRREDEAQQLKVDQVRALIEALSLKSYRGGYKVGVIEEAETLNNNGANAFLKTLEEPAAETLLIIIARPSHRLPATIASRCLRMTLKMPPAEVAIEWLERTARSAHGWSAALALSAGAPLAALELDASRLAALEADMNDGVRQLASGGVDVTLLAESWLRSDPVLRITWLENWITRRVQAALGGAASLQSAEPVGLPAALLKPKIRALFELLDALRDFRRLASTSMNLQLALESLLLGSRAALAR